MSSRSDFAPAKCRCWYELLGVQWILTRQHPRCPVHSSQAWQDAETARILAEAAIPEPGAVKSARRAELERSTPAMSASSPHGTYARYQRGSDGPCRCDACRAAARDYGRAYRAAGRDRWVNWVNEALGGCVRGLGWPRQAEESTRP